MVTEMQSDCSFSSKLTISSKEHYQLKKMMNDLDRKEVERIDRFSAVVRSLRQEYLDKFYGLIGKDNLQKYLRLHRRRIKKMRRMRRENSCGSEGLKKLEAQRQENIEASRRIVQRSGINPDKLESLQQKYLDKFRKAYRKIRPQQDKEEKRPSGRSARDLNVVYLRSPFDRASIYQRGDRSGNDVQLWGKPYADRSGDVSGESLLHAPDGDDWHDAFVLTNSQVGSYFRLPIDGDILVWARYKTYLDLNSYFYGYTRNDCAWYRECDIFADVTIRLCFYNISQGHALCKWRRLYRDGMEKHPLHVVDRDTIWDFNWWEEGDNLCTCIGPSGVRFNGPNYADDLVYLEAGLYTENVFSSEDYHVKSGLRHLYKLIEIGADCRFP
jgi:hypothetical protein